MLKALRQIARIDAAKRSRDHASWLGPVVQEASGSEFLCLGLGDQELGAAQRALADRVVEGLPAGDWLDIGAGLGGPAHRWLEDEDRWVTAYEIAPGRQSRMRRHPRLRGLVGDMDRMPFDAEFDAAILLESAHHGRELTQLLHQCWTALRPGGQLRAAVVLRQRERLRLYDVGVIRAAEQALGCAPLVTTEDWQRGLTYMCFEAVQIEDLTAEVLPVLPRWAEALDRVGGSTASVGARGLRYLAHRGLSGPLRYALVRATKSG